MCRLLAACFAFLLLVQGCSEDECLTFCEEVKQCKGNPKEVRFRDCEAFCRELRDAISPTGCSTELASLHACWAELDEASLCGYDAQRDCPSQSTAVDSCIARYCAAHPQAHDCQSSE